MTKYKITLYICPTIQQQHKRNNKKREMIQNLETEFLTAEDAAKLLGISKQTFHRLHSTKLPSLNISKDKKYPKGEVIKYLNSLIQPATRPLEANI